MILTRLKRYSLILGLVVFGTVLIVIDQDSRDAIYQAIERDNRNITTDQCLGEAVCPSTVPPLESPPLVDLPPDGLTPLPPTASPDPRTKEDPLSPVLPPPSTIGPDQQEPTGEALTAVGYSYLTKKISSALIPASGRSFTEREMIWLAEEFVRSLIRSERDGRDYIGRSELEWMRILLEQSKAIGR